MFPFIYLSAVRLFGLETLHSSNGQAQKAVYEHILSLKNTQDKQLFKKFYLANIFKGFSHGHLAVRL